MSVSVWVGGCGCDCIYLYSPQTEVESPLTKGIRVTAALVLRNLCREVTSAHT